MQKKDSNPPNGFCEPCGGCSCRLEIARIFQAPVPRIFHEHEHSAGSSPPPPPPPPVPSPVAGEISDKSDGQKPILPWNYLCGHVNTLVSRTRIAKETCGRLVCITVKEAREDDPNPFYRRLWKRACPANNRERRRGDRRVRSPLIIHVAEDATHSSTFEKKEKTEF